MKNLSLKYGLLKNKYLIGAFVLGTILQIGVVVLPPIAQVFNLVPLKQEQWLLTVGISIMPVIIMEIQKKINEIKFGKVIYKEEVLPYK